MYLCLNLAEEFFCCIASLSSLLVVKNAQDISMFA